MTHQLKNGFDVFTAQSVHFVLHVFVDDNVTFVVDRFDFVLLFQVDDHVAFPLGGVAALAAAVGFQLGVDGNVTHHFLRTVCKHLEAVRALTVLLLMVDLEVSVESVHRGVGLAAQVAQELGLWLVSMPDVVFETGYGGQYHAAVTAKVLVGASHMMFGEDVTP